MIVDTRGVTQLGNGGNIGLSGTMEITPTYATEKSIPLSTHQSLNGKDKVSSDLCVHNALKHA